MMNKPEPKKPENPQQERVYRNDTDYDAATPETNPKKYKSPEKDKSHPNYNYPETAPSEPKKTDKDITDRDL